MSEAFAVPRLREPFDVRLRMPGSKSAANRALAAACLRPGPTRLERATACEDVEVMVAGLQALGFDVRWEDRAAGRIHVRGGLPSEGSSEPVEIDCRLAGTALRFLTALAVVVPGRFVLTGDQRMQERPIAPLVRALRLLGAQIEDTDGCPPVRVGPGKARQGRTRLDASTSSQFLSALMLIGPALPGGLDVTLEAPPSSVGYVRLTKRALELQGHAVTLAGLDTGERVRVEPPTSGSSIASTVRIEGDWSAAGVWTVLARLTGSSFADPSLPAATDQGDAGLEAVLDHLGPSGDVDWESGEVPDQVMNLALFAAARRGRTRLRGIGNLSLKECDRLAVLEGELGRAGLRAERAGDGLDIRGGCRPRAATLDPHGDHRMVMAFTALGALADGIRVRTPDCVAKSYPGFLDDYLEVIRPTNRRALRVDGAPDLAAALAEELSRPLAGPGQVTAGDLAPGHGGLVIQEPSVGPPSAGGGAPLVVRTIETRSRPRAHGTPTIDLPGDLDVRAGVDRVRAWLSGLTRLGGGLHGLQ